MAPAASYPVLPRSKVQRYRTRAVYDYDFIHDIINSTTVLHVAFPPSLEADADPFPALLPMIGVVARYPDPNDDEDDEDDATKNLYLHGYVSSRLMRMSTKVHNAVLNGEAEDGFPLTVSATIVDGIVLSLTPNSHSYNYRSAVVHGYGEPVTDPDEKVWAMRQLTNKVVPERWENTRTPPTKTEMKTTNILKVKIVSASGKKREGGPHDDKHDLVDHSMREKVWTGVMPIWEQRGVPIKADDEAKVQVPAYLTHEVKSQNERKKAKAIALTREPK